MVRLLTIGILIFLINTAVISQNRGNPNELATIFFSNGLQFSPGYGEKNVLDSTFTFCNDFTKNYYLYGLPLTKEYFKALKLKDQDVDTERTNYKIAYLNNDESSCGITLHLYIYPKIPIQLNSRILSIQKDSIVKNIDPKSIMQIRRQKSLFKDYILISTN